MRFLVFLSAVTGSPTEKILHDVHEVVGWVVLTLVGTILVLGGAQTYLMRHKTKIELAIDRNPALRGAHDLCRSYLEPAYRKLFITSTLALCGMLYRSLEIGMLDRFNYVVAGALTDICVWLRLKLDVVGSYYVAIIWFVGGVLVSLILLFMA